MPASGATPLVSAFVPAGFPSPADDYVERALDLNEYLVKHPAATFFIRAAGDSMIGAGIHSGDLLVVDRSLEPHNNSIVIAALEGELTVKRLRRREGRLFLAPENDAYPLIPVEGDSAFEVWGVVTAVIHHF